MSRELERSHFIGRSSSQRTPEVKKLFPSHVPFIGKATWAEVNHNSSSMSYRLQEDTIRARTSWGARQELRKRQKQRKAEFYEKYD